MNASLAPQSQMQLAVHFHAQGQLDSARAALEMALAAAPDYSTALENLGDVYLQMAADAYQRGLQISPHDLPMLTNLGNLYREMGQIVQARVLMQRAVTQAGEHVPSALLNNLGLLELNEGNFGTALDLFQRALWIFQNEESGGHPQLSSESAGVGATISANINRAEVSLAALK